MNKVGPFVVFSLAVVFAASDAKALTAYVPEGPEARCASRASAPNANSVHRVGAFELTGVGVNKANALPCAQTPGCTTSKPVYPLGFIGDFLRTPVAVGVAAVNDVFYAWTMPVRETERLS